MRLVMKKSLKFDDEHVEGLWVNPVQPLRLKE
jgi:hypothetical protein